MVNITTLIQTVTAYIDKVVGGNEFASGMVIGGVTGTLAWFGRSIPNYISIQLNKHLTTTISFNSTQESFHKLMKYFLKEGLADKARTIRVGNGQYGDDDESIKQVGYGNQYFMYEGHPIKVKIRREEGSQSSVVKEFLDITKLGRSHKLFNTMLRGLETSDVDNSKTSYYQWGDYDKEWVCDQPKRMMDNIVLTKSNREVLLHTLNNFVNKEKWFINHGIPYQLGILLHGPSGTGKTSLIRAIASYLDKDIVFVSSVSTLANAAQKVKNGIIVAEEIDIFGIGNRNSKDKHDPFVKETKESQDLTNDRKTDISDDIIALHGLKYIMTALDGVVSNHGRIVILTTNYIEKLDSALLRPGRIDLQLKMDYFNMQTFQGMLKKFFNKVNIVNRKLLPNISPAMVQNDVINGLGIDSIVNKYTEEIQQIKEKDEE